MAKRPAPEARLVAAAMGTRGQVTHALFATPTELQAGAIEPGTEALCGVTHGARSAWSPRAHGTPVSCRGCSEWLQRIREHAPSGLASIDLAPGQRA